MRWWKLQIVQLGTVLIEKKMKRRAKKTAAAVAARRHETPAIKAQTQIQTPAHSQSDKLITSAMLFHLNWLARYLSLADMAYA